MLAALGLAGLSAGGSLLSGIGASQASAKQARLQQIADGEARRLNEEQQRMVMDEGRRLGQELLLVPEVTRTQRSSSASSGSWVDVDGMMAAAERAGFNPTTWLNAGGMQAYTQGWSKSDDDNTVTVTGHNAADAYKLMMPQMLVAQPGTVPQQSSMLSAFGGALTAGASAFGQQYRADQSYDVQMARLLAGSANQGMGLSTNNGLSTALQFGTGGGVTSPKSTSAGGLSDLPYPQNWKMDDVKVTNPFQRAFIDSTQAGAEAGEDRYGEIGELLFGLRNMVGDGVRNVTGKSLADWGIAAGMDIGSYKAPTDTSWGPSFARWWNSPTSLPNRTLPGFSGSNGGAYMPFPGAAAY